MEMVVGCYRLTTEFPKEELFGLVAQIRRSAVSVPSKLAEGHGRGIDVDFVRFLHISYGSLSELETQLILAKRLAMTDEKSIEPLLIECDRLARMLSGLIRARSKASNRLTGSSANDQRPTTNDQRPPEGA